jgi:predicted RND superfamily exporter protein
MTVIAVSLALLSTLVLLPSLVVGIDSWRDRRRLDAVGDTAGEAT